MPGGVLARPGLQRRDAHVEPLLLQPAVAVVADRAKIETILSNLVDNAIKYSPGGGEVRLELATRDGFALVTVSDHGIGIAKEDMKVLFTRFGRIANDSTTRIPGTGLGLYLARELCLNNGAMLDYEYRSEIPNDRRSQTRGRFVITFAMLDPI